MTEWRRVGRGRLGARPRRARARPAARTRGSSTSTRPHNPTGTLMPRDVLDRVVELCAERGAWLFCDEVYRELEHDPADRLPAACDLYERALSLGSMSKTYGLPGLRLGWLASRDRDALQRSSTSSTTRRSARARRASSSARSRCGIASPRRAQPRRSCSRTCRCSTRSSSGMRSASRGCGRRRARSASRASTASEDTTGFCEQLVAETGCSCFPAPSTTSRVTFGSASGAQPCPRRSQRLERWIDTRS